MRFLSCAGLLLWSLCIQAQGLKDYYKDYFNVGVAVSPRLLETDASAELIRKEFNSMTPENVMKMGPIHPKENEYNWEPADKIMAFAQHNNLKVRGHCLCWHNQTPDWFFTDADGNDVTREVLLNRLKTHIHAVVGRYKGEIYAWDVVNEAVPDGSDDVFRQTKFLEIIGEDYIQKAFEFAHEADPDAVLFYNDYNTENAQKREKIYQLVKSLKEKGVPIHGVGLQGHWSNFEPSKAEVSESIRKFGSLGLQVQITEMDISVYPKRHEGSKEPFKGKAVFTKEMEATQEAQYKMLFEVFRENKQYLTGVTFWNLSDQASWLDNFPIKGRKDFPLLFDQKLERKKAYKAVAEF